MSAVGLNWIIFFSLRAVSNPTESEEHGFCFLKLSVHCMGCWLELENCILLPAVSPYEPVVSAVGLNWIIALACQLLAVMNLCSPTESEAHGFHCVGRWNWTIALACHLLALMNLYSPTESEKHGFCFLKLSDYCVVGQLHWLWRLSLCRL